MNTPTENSAGRMSPEAQRIAIAEACGVELMTPGWGPTYNDPDNAGCAPAAEPAELPDYLNDLNAMHEAEATLSLNDRRGYAYELARIVFRTPVQYAYNGHGAFDLDEDFAFGHANAAQRAEAFLRTLGKWKESK